MGCAAVEGEDTARARIARADEKLYAKRSGRNRVCF
jgi:PleD family two-component response regulator